MPDELPNFRSGDAAIVGKPNAGKSTLFNALLGSRLAIVTPKPQTTRVPLLGVLTRPDYQVLFWDTPGLLDPKYRLQEVMRAHAARRAREADLVLGLLDANDLAASLDEDLLNILTGVRGSLVVVLNKVDLLQPASLPQAIARAREVLKVESVLPISALRGNGLQELIETIGKRLPPGPRLYDEDTLTDQPERFFVAELIREVLFERLSRELPYATAVAIEEFKDRDQKTYIRANICVERDSQKGIVIGAKARMLKAVGAEARKRIEAFLERPVYLDLYVKVRENWRKKDADLKDFGYV